MELVITDELEAEYRRAVEYPRVRRQAARVDRQGFVEWLFPGAYESDQAPARRGAARRSTSGVGILKVTEGGRAAVFEAVAPVSNIDSSGVERADVHAMTLRVVP